MDEKFKDIPPLTQQHNLVAEVEKNPQYTRNVGEIWLDSGWLTVAQARELRDWLNRVIP